MQRSPRNEVLRNEYLLSTILCFLDPEAFYDEIYSLDPSTRIDLRSASLTCKAFFIPASTLLWKMMVSVLPLLKLLPNFALVNGVYTINETSSSADCRAMQLYGPMVRYLDLDTFNDTIIWHAILRLTSLKKSIFPNLQSVHVPSLKYDDVKSSENLNVLFLAYSDKLTSLSLSRITTATEEITASYLSVLGQKDAPLQEIILGGCLTANTLEGPIGAFSCLKHLQVDLDDKTNLTFSVFLSWSSLPSLTRLVVEMLRSCKFVHTGAGLRDPAVKFKTLQKLRFAGPASEILKMLRTMDESESLIAIELGCRPGRNPKDDLSKPLTNCMLECVRVSKCLKSLGMRTGPAIKAILHEDSLSTLFNCKQLEELEIGGGICLPQVDDNSIHELCLKSNWNNLQVLHLPSSAHVSGPSLFSLGIIARNLPSVVELHIAVDLRLKHINESLAKEIASPRIHHGLKRLFILKANSRVLSNKLAIKVSRYIEHHFPHLETIGFYEDPGFQSIQVDDRWWDGVVDLIREYRTFRKEILSEATQ